MTPRAELLAYLLDNVNRNFMDELRDSVRQEVQAACEEAMAECGYTETCLNCKHFREMSETCGLTEPPQRPPARIIAFGCPKFEEEPEPVIGIVQPDDIPALSPLATQKRIGEVPNSDPWLDYDDDIPF